MTEVRFDDIDGINAAAGGDYGDWGDPERIVVNVDTLYREFGAPPLPPDPLRLLRAMSEYERR